MHKNKKVNIFFKYFLNFYCTFDITKRSNLDWPCHTNREWHWCTTFSHSNQCHSECGISIFSLGNFLKKRDFFKSGSKLKMFQKLFFQHYIKRISRIGRNDTRLKEYAYLDIWVLSHNSINQIGHISGIWYFHETPYSEYLSKIV